MISILVTLGFIECDADYSILITVISISGFVLSVYNFIRLNR